jgi:hypothetical protein
LSYFSPVTQGSHFMNWNIFLIIIVECKIILVLEQENVPWNYLFGAIHDFYEQICRMFINDFMFKQIEDI